ncbi:MAG: Type 1 glutamine amidotransferase-like domain-containing protein [Gemmatimonadaceae bacterium]
MQPPPKPVYLLADSQALFARDHAHPIADALRAAVEHDAPRAAYIGACNGDEPAFYQIFEAAMDLAGVRDCRMIRASFSDDEMAYLDTADIILLAGGDPARGWRAIDAAGIAQRLRDRYFAGVVLIGVSAGAVLLGEQVLSDDADADAPPTPALRIVPWIVDAHDEERGWTRLRHAMSLSGTGGLGLSAGGGLVCHGDMTLEPIRRPVALIRDASDDLPQLLLPQREVIAAAAP